jgi:hypothetical protein
LSCWSLKMLGPIGLRASRKRVKEKICGTPYVGGS